MAVYVDDMYKTNLGQYQRMKMSHMLADTREELMAMAKALNLKMEWLQKRGTPSEHFDISLLKRQMAIRLGAQEVSMKFIVRKIQEKKLNERKHFYTSF